jgi:hypothetical protein
VSAGVPTLQVSYNVTSITDSAVGVLIVNIATDFSSANWVPQVSFQSTSTPRTIHTTNQSAGAVTATVYNSSTAASADPDSYGFTGYGDH